MLSTHSSCGHKLALPRCTEVIAVHVRVAVLEGFEGSPEWNGQRLVICYELTSNIEVRECPSSLTVIYELDFTDQKNVLVYSRV